MKVIGFIGPKGAGKDASASILKDAGISSGKISFAAPLKSICAKVFGFKVEDFESLEFKERILADTLILSEHKIRIIKDLMVQILPPEKYGYEINCKSTDDLVGTEFKTVRQMLQFVGTELIRERVWNNWHIHAALSEAKKNLKPNAIYCITDIRFLNEYNSVVNNFGETASFFYVDRPIAEDALLTSVHQSEREILKIKTMLKPENFIYNNGTLKDLAIKLLNRESY